MRNEGLGSWFERRLRMSPDRPAVVFEGGTTTQGELAVRVRRVASVLEQLGVGRGDRVAYVGGNHPSCLEVLYACGVLGAIYVPVNARLTVPEVAFVLADSGAEVVVHGRDHGGHADALAAAGTGVRAWVAAEPPRSGGRDSLDYASLVAAADPTHRDLPVSLADDCLIMYTSGTTGRPKGAVLTHGNVTWNTVNQLIGLDLAPREVTLALAPLFHIGGLNGTVNPTMMRGGSVVVVRSFDAEGTLGLIERERVNSFFAVPTMIDLLSRAAGFATRDLSSLRTVGVGGAPLPMPVLQTWLARGITVQQVYGMTEAAPSGTSLESEDAASRAGSAGRMAFFTDVRVVDPDGAETAPGEVGEVVLQGPNIMRGYWNRPEDTARAVRDGWYHSGDAASVDEDGYLWVRDRYQDLVISGGENIYPAEVESALLEVPGVVEAAVVGVPDERWGEVGLAYLVVEPLPGGSPAPDADAVLHDVRTRLAAFKVPRHVRLVEALPRTATGKIRKSELRQHDPRTAASPGEPR